MSPPPFGGLIMDKPVQIDQLMELMKRMNGALQGRKRVIIIVPFIIVMVLQLTGAGGADLVRALMSDPGMSNAETFTALLGGAGAAYYAMRNVGANRKAADTEKRVLALEDDAITPKPVVKPGGPSRA